MGHVAPVNSGLWWTILLRAYGKCPGDLSVQERIDVQSGIKMILKLCLADGFDMFPTLLVTDGSCMIDRRMAIHGHPLEIQAYKVCQTHQRTLSLMAVILHRSSLPSCSAAARPLIESCS
ncbi:hypothetical protein ACQ4PT_012698 [Festuca glaucescens]